MQSKGFQSKRSVMSSVTKERCVLFVNRKYPEDKSLNLIVGGTKMYEISCLIILESTGNYDYINLFQIKINTNTIEENIKCQ